jgi:protein phosphatase
MRNLICLVIAANKLPSLPSLSFASFQELDFFVNLLTEVPEGIPNSVINLRLSFNNVCSFELRLPHLLRLQLSGNLIQVLSPNCLFPSLQKLDLIVVGDLHGNIDDLLQILGNFGYPPARSYLFLGDYVDRGSNSIEVLLLLYSLKGLFPHQISLLRGNHECKSVCNKYGFAEECAAFFETKEPYKGFCESFCSMPIAAVINDRIFCVHGGLSPDINSLSDICEIRKPLTNVGISPAEDLLWSDPSNDCDGFERSERRRVGFLFNHEVTSNFLSDNGLTKMIRAHEFCESGLNWTFDDCLTIFSACDYCAKGNLGAVAVVSQNDTVTIHQFRKCNPELLPYLLKLPQWFLEMGIPEEPFVAGEMEPAWLSV